MTPHFKTIRDALESLPYSGLNNLRADAFVSLSQLQKEREELVDVIQKALDECCDLTATPAGDAMEALLEKLRGGEPSEAKSSLPPDVVRLVVAAREAAYGGVLDDDNIRYELDAACEAFADRVPWEDEPLTPTHKQEAKV